MKNAQPEMSHAKGQKNWTFCSSVQKQDYSSDEQGPDSDVQLLHVASLQMNGISDKQKTGGRL